MKFGGLKIGKSNEGKGKEKTPASGVSPQMAELEAQLNDQMDNLKQAEARIKKLNGKKGNGKDLDDTGVTRHGPIGELSVDPDNEMKDFVMPEIDESDEVPEENVPPVKLVEVKIKPEAGETVEKPVKVEPVAGPPAANKDVKAEPAPHAAAAAKKTKTEAAPPPAPENSSKDTLSKEALSSLFAQDEEEENPLAGLLRSLPEVDANELLEDIKEIKGIIEDWQKK